MISQFFSEPNSPIDRILREGYFPDYSYNGVFIDVGAADPVEINDSWHFELNGWETWCIEPNPRHAISLRAKRKNVIEAAVSTLPQEFVEFTVMKRGNYDMSLSAIIPDPAYVEAHKTYEFEPVKIKVKNMSLRSLVEKNLPMKKIDVLKIDVEGWELDVLKSLDLSVYKPSVMVIENLLHSPTYGDFICQFGYKIDRKESYNYFFFEDYMIIVAGDSHVQQFMGEPHPCGFGMLATPFYCFWLGPRTCWNFMKNCKEPLTSILKKHWKANDKLVISCGEIDCRRHVVPQAESRGIKIEEATGEVAERYMIILSEFKDWNPVALGLPPQMNAPQKDYAPNGTPAQRNLAVRVFNERLSDHSPFWPSPGQSNPSLVQDQVHVFGHKAREILLKMTGEAP